MAFLVAFPIPAGAPGLKTHCYDVWKVLPTAHRIAATVESTSGDTYTCLVLTHMVNAQIVPVMLSISFVRLRCPSVIVSVGVELSSGDRRSMPGVEKTMRHTHRKKKESHRTLARNARQ